MFWHIIYDNMPWTTPTETIMIMKVLSLSESDWAICIGGHTERWAIKCDYEMSAAQL